MGKTSLFVTVALLATTLLPKPHEAQGMTDEEKKAAFLESRSPRSSAPSSPSVPKPTPARISTTPKKSQAPAKPKPKPKIAPKKTKSAPKPTPAPTPTPPRRTIPPPPSPKPAATPTPASRSIARPSPTPTPAPTPRLGRKGAVVVQKSGGLDSQEILPPPAPEKKGWFFKRSKKYKYLTPAVREAIDKASVRKHRWLYIVVHNSGTRQGNAKAFDYYHRKVRKMENGLAYHFVIGNGTSSGNGAIEIGPRWRRQINGGHVRSDYLNNIAIGICLVGDYNRDKPTEQQMEALEELIRYVRKRVGKTNRKEATIKTHKDINPVPTDCPGDRFPYRSFYSRFD